MDTKISIIKDIHKNIKSIEEAASVIKEGGVVAFPTETVYGLGADALNPLAVKKIFEAKGRPQDNPLIIHVANKNLESLVKEIPSIANKIMDRFWPGPLTLIFKKKNIIPDVTSANLDTIGVRMPSNEIALKLIESSGTPIAAPSANISGRPSPTDVERCIEDLEGKIDYILGGNRSDVGVESTILDLSVDPPCVLRPGGITLEMLKEIDERIYIDPAIMKKSNENIKPKAPGMKYRHYAPKAKIKIINGNTEKTIEKIKDLLQNYIDNKLSVGVMTCDEHINYYSNQVEIISLGSRKKLDEIAKNLFEALRSFDDRGVDIILAEGYEEKDLGIAIMNRLKKAAAYDILEV
ncbi:L-threonylcarbamoyladenylate synthase [Clostridium intestinale]|uniref:Threonylcarbamoyl-AMP synthase n=1 Tax=Clostridium intestinale DSM 6191 TaxID=1121320 RepID=A0A1M6D9R8_9CLOT|nr:L-threonylcarbamoyladenylate synthase [Clostridium intestinale]SHI69925.1 L-threonylcarbamoyladenylate synthase [Clostridium intestinale DSM 6191]